MAGKVLVCMDALNLMPQICSSFISKNHNNIHVYATFHLNAPNHVNVRVASSCMMCAEKTVKS